MRLDLPAGFLIAAVAVATLVAGCGDSDNGHTDPISTAVTRTPTPTATRTPLPAECDASELCGLDECVPLDDCFGSCHADPNAPGRSTCFLRRAGGRPNNVSGPVHRVVIDETIACDSDESPTDPTFHRSGACTTMLREGSGEYFCDGVCGQPCRLSCALDPGSPSTCRVRITHPDGGVEEQGCTLPTGFQ